MNEHSREPRPRRPLREDVREIDKDILHLLLRRHNMLKKMRNVKGFLEPSEEKFLRESWEAAVSRISRDARLSTRMFALMQEVEFLPRPEEGGERRPAFNLAPPPGPVKLDMTAPLDGRATCAWMFLSAISGRPVSLAPCLMNDLVVDGVKLFNQMGASLNRADDGRVAASGGTPATCPDKVLHVGSDIWNFHLALALYLGRPARAKFSGSADLRLGNFSSVGHFLPLMGARLVHVVPRSEGFPVRVECSGLLPDRTVFPADAPIELAEAIALAASTYAKPLTLDLAGHPDLRLLQERTMPLLRQIGAPAELRGDELILEPGEIALPAEPVTAMEAELALFLLALAPAMGGRVRLGGLWPKDAASEAGIAFLEACGAQVRRTETEVVCTAERPLQSLPDAVIENLSADLPEEWLPLPAALAALAALRSGESVLPKPDAAPWHGEGLGFFTESGIGISEGRLKLLPRKKDADRADGEPTALSWNAPTPGWALALALAACGRPADIRGFRLGNPGIVMSLHPGFWALYNALPEPKPAVRQEKEPVPEQQPRRRRVLTNVTAVLPEPRDIDE